jgi:hypothetical protein
MDNNTFSFNPADLETAQGLFQTMFRLQEVARENIIPAIVRAYNPRTHFADVLPIVNMVVEQEKDGQKQMKSIKRPRYKVKVYQHRHGGYIIDMPLKAGDTGFLVAVDRNWQNARKANQSIARIDHKGAKSPETYETASFANGVFYPFSFINDKLYTKEPDSVMKRRYAKILEMPEPDEMLAVRVWTGAEDLVISREVAQGHGDKTVESSPDCTPYVGLRKDGVVMRGGKAPTTPSVVRVTNNGTEITCNTTILALPEETDHLKNLDPRLGNDGHESYTTESGRETWIKKVNIDPLRGLGETDAKLRKIFFLSVQDSTSFYEDEKFYEGEIGANNVWLMQARVLADHPIKVRKVKLPSIPGDGSGTASGGGGAGGGGCDCPDIDVSGSDSVMVDFLYDLEGNKTKNIAPYTLRFLRGKVRISAKEAGGGTGIDDKTKKGFELTTVVEEDKEERIPTTPISELVEDWALKYNEETLPEDPNDYPTEIKLKGAQGSAWYILRVDDMDADNPKLEIIKGGDL